MADFGVSVMARLVDSICNLGEFAWRGAADTGSVAGEGPGHERLCSFGDTHNPERPGTDGHML